MEVFARSMRGVGCNVPPVAPSGPAQQPMQYPQTPPPMQPMPYQQPMQQPQWQFPQGQMQMDDVWDDGAYGWGVEYDDDGFDADDGQEIEDWSGLLMGL